MMKCETCGYDGEATEKDINTLSDRIAELEKALDDVLGEINNARSDLDDAEKIVGKHT